jgi:dipeptidase E
MTQNNTKRRIFACGAGLQPPFLRYMASLTGKPKPRICFLPTAIGDHPAYIDAWFERCAGLDIEPHVQKMFTSSYEQKVSFEEYLLSMDGIVVSGGNTLNMMAIWKAHGIDQVLRKAWDRGIVLAGGSAGSLCWFEHGTTDSRPIEITTVECLGFIKASHCPHYDSESTRRPKYHAYIGSGEFKAGYACDDQAGILFEDDKPVKVVALREESNAYYVYKQGDEVKEEKLEKEILQS